MKGKLIGLLMGASIVLAACGGGSEEASSDGKTASADPEQIFSQSCAQCHGADLKGRGNAVDLSAIGAQYSQEEIEKIIVEGNGGGMPGGMIKDTEKVAVLAEWLAAKK